MKKFGNILWGIVLITIGVIFGLNAMGITNLIFSFADGGPYLLLSQALLS